MTKVIGGNEVSTKTSFREVKTGGPDHQVRGSEENLPDAPPKKLQEEENCSSPKGRYIWVFHGKQNVYCLNTLNLKGICKIFHAIAFLYFL